MRRAWPARETVEKREWVGSSYRALVKVPAVWKDPLGSPYFECVDPDVIGQGFGEGILEFEVTLVCGFVPPKGLKARRIGMVERSGKGVEFLP